MISVVERILCVSFAALTYFVVFLLFDFCSYGVQTLVSSSNGAVMIDPLSLNDFPEVEVGRTLRVDVKTSDNSQSYGTKTTTQSERK